MRVTFVNRKDSRRHSVLTFSSPKKNKSIMKYSPKKKYNIFSHIKHNMIPKEEISKYYKISERLQRRNTIETSRPLKKIKRNCLKERARTLRGKSKIKNKYKLLSKKKRKYQEITAERIHLNLIEEFNFENNEERVNFLMNLKPFYEKLHTVDRHSEGIIRAITPEYKGKVLPGNQVIFRYGDEFNDFYVIHKGKVNLYFPFIESMYMNIDEYYIYLLRLRRYREIEMLNNVLLMNNNAFMRVMDGPFNFDEFILKLYNTFIKIKFSPVFLNQKDNKKYNGGSSGYINRPNHLKKKIYISEKEFDDNIYKTFTDKEMKNLVIRIENELIETIKWIMPEELRQIIREELNGEIVKKIAKIPDYLVLKFKSLNPDEIKKDNYISRIVPIKIFNTNLSRQKIKIMRYLHIKTISTGDYFGDFTNDTVTFFGSHLINIMRHSKLNLKIHKYDFFQNMTAISVRDNNDDLGGYLYLGLIDRGSYIQYFKRFIEKTTYAKKKFILNSRLFKNCKNENLIKTYSNCFQPKILKENDCLINEKTILTEDNTFVYFIKKGDFHSVCSQTVQTIDKILTYLNCHDKIADTIPIKLNKIKDTFFFEEVCKKELKIKLNFITENDIVGLAENILGKYFNSVNCISKEGIAYYVDARIIQLLVESDSNIRDNKNLLLYNKYKVLSESLLRQRKSYLDSFCSFQIDSIKEKENSISKFTKKKYNVFHSKEKYKRVLSHTPKYVNIKGKRKKLNDLRDKKFRSLSCVCDVLSKISGRATAEDKQKERNALYKKKHIEESEKNKRYRSYEMKEINMTCDILEELEYQKNNYLCFKCNPSSKTKTSNNLYSSFSNSNIYSNEKNRRKINYNLKYNSINDNCKSNLIIKENFFKDEKKNLYAGSMDRNAYMTPGVHHNSLWTNKNKNYSFYNLNNYGNSCYERDIRMKLKRNNIDINKLNQIRIERKEILNQKLRNIYTSDLEKILLNDQNKNIYY